MLSRSDQPTATHTPFSQLSPEIRDILRRALDGKEISRFVSGAPFG